MKFGLNRRRRKGRFIESRRLPGALICPISSCIAGPKRTNHRARKEKMEARQRPKWQLLAKNRAY